MKNVSYLIKRFISIKKLKGSQPFYFESMKMAIDEFKVKGEDYTKVNPCPFKSFILVSKSEKGESYSFFLIEAGHSSIKLTVYVAHTNKHPVEFVDKKEIVFPYGDGVWTTDLTIENSMAWSYDNKNPSISTPIGDEIAECFVYMAYAMVSKLNSRNAITLKTKKNNRLIDKSTDIKTLTVSKGDYYIVNLADQKAHEESLAKGTHASPITHQRRSHIRRYKNGKEVIVSSSIVNKGKNPLPTQEYRV